MAAFFFFGQHQTACANVVGRRRLPFMTTQRLPSPGEKINSWTILARATSLRSLVPCHCECGREGLVKIENIPRGLSRACKSCASRRAKTKHGASDCGRSKKGDRLYRAWKAMKWRCNPK